MILDNLFQLTNESIEENLKYLRMGSISNHK